MIPLVTQKLSSARETLREFIKQNDSAFADTKELELAQEYLVS